MAIRAARPVDRRITPHLIVRNLDRAIDFYRHAFDAEVLYRSAIPGGGPGLHAQLQVADSCLLVSEENMGMPEEVYKRYETGPKTRSPETLEGSSVILELYVEDVEKAFRQAVSAGARVKMPLGDAFYGDRYGQLVDPFGHVWALATARESLTAEEVDGRAAEYFRAMPGRAG